MSDPYNDYLIYRGEGGIFITLRCARRWNGRFRRWRGVEWFVQRPTWLRTEHGPFRTKFAALLAVAHESKMSGQRANLLPVKP